MCEQTACANALASFQPNLSSPLTESGVTTCRPLPPVVLQNVTEPELFQPLLYLLGRLDHHVKANVRRRIEIKHQATRQRRMMGLVVPGMIFDGGDLRSSDQSFDRSIWTYGFRSPSTVTSAIRFDMPCIAWR